MLHCPVGKAEDVAGLVDRREVKSIETLPALRPARAPWNKGLIVGQKRPLLPKDVWSIRVRLEMADNKRDLALFNMAIDCKLRGCDLVLTLPPTFIQRERDSGFEFCLFGRVGQRGLARSFAGRAASGPVAG